MSQIKVPDEQFVIATGANVDAGRDSSVIDAPSPGLTALRIKTSERDDDPARFDVGETVDLRYSLDGRTSVLKDAQVIVSEPASTGLAGVIFEGTTQKGETIHLAWTPDFDVRAFTEKAYASGNTPRMVTRDQTADSYEMPCFAAGTRILTPSGPRPVERIAPGDLVLTRDSGAQPVLWRGRAPVLGRGDMAPVVFAPGTLGNAAPLVLSQQHRVLVRSARAALMFGAEEMFAHARAFAGLPGIRMVERRRVTWCHLLLPRHEVVLAEGVPCESLFAGDVALRRLGACGRAGEVTRLYTGRIPACDHALARPALRHAEARLLLFGAGEGGVARRRTGWRRAS